MAYHIGWHSSRFCFPHGTQRESKSCHFVARNENGVYVLVKQILIFPLTTHRRHDTARIAPFGTAETSRRQFLSGLFPERGGRRTEKTVDNILQARCHSLPHAHGQGGADLTGACHLLWGVAHSSTVRSVLCRATKTPLPP